MRRRRAASPRVARAAAGAAMGLGLWWAAVAHAAPHAYVANQSAQTVTVVDAATDTVSAVVPVGASPAAVALSADGAKVFVANAGSMSVSIVDGGTQAVVGTLALTAAPSSLAASPDGSQLYAVLGGNMLQAIDVASGAVLASTALDAAGRVAISPDGARLYMAAGTLQVFDTTTLARTAAVISGADHAAYHLAVSPDGSRIWVAHGIGLFSGGVVGIDAAALTVVAQIGLGAIPGPIAVGPDGGRVYVGIQATWVDTGYGAGFFPGRTVAVIDAATARWIAHIDLGATGSNWTQQNTAAGVAVTPDRRRVVISVPRLNHVAIADANTHTLLATPAVGASPGAVAAARRGATIAPYALSAAADTFGATTLGTASAGNVLSNDRLGGMAPTTAHVELTVLAASHPAVRIDATSGNVSVDPGTPVGAFAMSYRICERGSPSNCAEAVATVNVTAPRTIDAVDDAAQPYPGTASALNVLANDKLGGVAATVGTTRLTQLASTHAGVTLNTANGVISVAAGVPPGGYGLVYRLCEAAVPTNCDDASVQIGVIARPIVAGDDFVSTTRVGGRVLGSVLTNDRLAGAAATLANVTVAPVSASDPGLLLNAADGSITVAHGIAAGMHTLVYRICERASPSNCADGTVTVTVTAFLIDAVNDSARASSKRASTALASVLGNDTLGGQRATTGNVSLSLVSVTPANPKIVLDAATGAIRVTGKSQSGTFAVVYRICEIGAPANCDQATATIDLSGGL